MFKKFSLLAIIGLLFFAVAGCNPTTTVSELTDTEKVAAVLDGIDLGSLTAVNADLTLPTAPVNGVTLTWSTTNADVVTTGGDVTLPDYTDGDQTVTLTVTATLNAVTQTKTFTVTVTKEAIATFLNRAGAAIIISNSDSITVGFNLPATSLGATVTWESSNTAVASIATTAVDGFYAVTVTRPSTDLGESNASVTLTATVAFGDSSITVTKPIRVMAEAGAVHVTTIAEGLALALGTYITWEDMTIVGVGTDGFFFTDGTDVMFVYSSTVSATVTAGNVYDVTGGIALYNSIPEVQNISTNVVKAVATEAAARPITPTVATIDEIIANHVGYDATNPMQFGVYSVTGKVYYNADLGNYGTYLIPTDASTLDKTHALRIYYKSNMAAVSAVAGQTVTLTYVVFGYNNGATYLDWYGYFFGTADDIEVAFATDQAAVDAAFASLTIPGDVLATTTLSLPSALYGVTLTYASSNNAIVNATTGLVDLTGITSQISVTLTVTATKGTVVGATHEFTIKVGETPLIDIADVYTTDVAALSIIRIQGILIGKSSPTAFWIQDATGGLDIYAASSAVQDQLTPLLGQEVELIGKKELFNGLYEITTITSVIVINATPTPIVPASLNSVVFSGTTLLPYQGQLVSFDKFILTSEPVVDATYGNVSFSLLNLANGSRINVKYDSRVGVIATVQAALTAFHVGDSVNVVGAILGWSSNNPLLIITNENQVVAGTAVTDADYLAFDALKFVTELTLDTNYVLPVPTYATVTVKAVSEGLTAYVADGTTQLTITSPVGENATGTVTLTLTLNETTLDIVVAVTVNALTNAQKLASDLADLTVTLTANEFDSVTLPVLGAKGSTISWAVTSGAATLNVAALAYDYTGANHNVVLTATLSIGTETAVTKEFTVAVSALTMVSITDIYTQIQALGTATQTITGTVQTMTGTIIGFKWKSGYVDYSGMFLTDGVNVIFVYYGTIHPADYAVGDVVVLTGTTQTYYYLPEVGSVTMLHKIPEGNPASYAPVDVTLADIYAYTATDTIYYSVPITVTGTLMSDGTEGNTYLLDGTNRLYFSYVTGNYAALAAAYNGKEVTLTGGFLMDYYSSKTAWRFTGAETVITLTDAQVALDEVNAFVVETQVASEAVVVLPTTAGTSTITWSLADTTYATLDGNTVTFAAVVGVQQVALVASFTHPTADGSLATMIEYVFYVMNEAGYLTADKDALTITLTANEETTVLLPALGVNGSVITWAVSSGQASVTDGSVTYEYVGADYTVVLTATLSYTKTDTTVITDTKEFTVAVHGVAYADRLVAEVALLPATIGLAYHYTIPTVYAPEFSLVVPVELTGYVALSADGTKLEITRPSGTASVTGTVTLTVTYGTSTQDVSIVVTVLGNVDLFFSEYIEGSSSNKAIEIYNGTGVDVDLSGYSVVLCPNGKVLGDGTTTLNLTGTLLAGDVYVIYNSSANAAIKAVGDIASTITYYNGDDFVGLMHNGVFIDSIGQLGFDPGTLWGVAAVNCTLDMTLVRINTITVGDTNPYDAYDPSTAWVAYAIDTTTYLGSYVIS